MGGFGFNRPTSAPQGAPATGGAPPAPRPNTPARPGPARVSRWAGVTSAEPRDPMPRVGVYRFRVLSCEQGFNPGKGTESFKCHLQVVGAMDGSEDPAGHECVIVELLSGKAMQSGMARTKAFIVAASGYEDDASYDAFSSDGGHIDAVLGAANGYSSQTIVGRLVDCRVSRGKPVNPADPGGDYYRTYEWCPVPEAEQDQTPQPGAQAPAGAA